MLLSQNQPSKLILAIFLKPILKPEEKYLKRIVLTSKVFKKGASHEKQTQPRSRVPFKDQPPAYSIALCSAFPHHVGDRRWRP